MKPTIFCGPWLYEYEGWLFEYGDYTGPWPLVKRDLSPRYKAGRKFWAMWDRFSALPKEEQERYLVCEGGCLTIGG